jgi:hypothetical protein
MMLPEGGVARGGVNEYLEAIRERYGRAERMKKSQEGTRATLGAGGESTGPPGR